MVAVAAGRVTAGWQWYRAERHLITAQAEAKRAESNLEQAENTLLDLAWIIEESALWAPESVSFRETVDAKLKKYLEQISAHGDAEQSPILAAVYSFAGHSANPVREGDSGGRYFRLAVDLWRQLVAAHPDNESYRRGLSLCLFHFSQQEAAWRRHAGVDPVPFRREFYRNIRDDKRFGNWTLYEYAQVLFDRANSLFNNPAPLPALEVYETGLTALEVLLESSPAEPKFLLSRGQFLMRMVRTKRRLRDGSGGEEMPAAARESFEQVLKQNPDHPVARAELAEVHRYQGVQARNRNHLGAAEESLKSSVALSESLIDPQKPDFNVFLQLGDSNRDLAYVQLALKKKDQALRSFGRCREYWAHGLAARALTLQEQKQMAFACHDEGVLAQELNESSVAKAAFAVGVEAFRYYLRDGESIDPERRVRAKQVLNQAECHFYLARHQAAAGEIEAAIVNLETAIEILEPTANDPAAVPDGQMQIRERYHKAQTTLAEVKKNAVTGSSESAEPQASSQDISRELP